MERKRVLEGVMETPIHRDSARDTWYVQYRTYNICQGNPCCAVILIAYEVCSCDLCPPSRAMEYLGLFQHVAGGLFSPFPVTYVMYFEVYVYVFTSYRYTSYYISTISLFEVAITSNILFIQIYLIF